MGKHVIAVWMALFVPWAASGSAVGEPLPAFPGAEGFGCTTPGGRGGEVVEVTNLADDGPGSLRAAVAHRGPRLIVFRTAGTIELHSPIPIVHPYITIAGQTAPGDGITLKNSSQNIYAPLQVKTHDVVIRYLRSRPGPSGIPPRSHDGSTVDALTIGDPQRQVYNVVIDHCSFSWSVDEVVNSWYDARDLTIQWCIMSEGLHAPPERQGVGSKGPLFGGRGSGRISAHHNLLAHNLGRNPMVKASGTVDLVNNLIFVPGTIATVVDGELGACHVNAISNLVLAPSGDGLVYGLRVLGPDPVSLFVRGNLGPYRKRPDQPEVDFVAPQNGGRQRLRSEPEPAPPVTSWDATELEAELLPAVGCSFPRRDAVDLRIVADVQARRTRLISDPEDVGGWPELAPGVADSDKDSDGMPDAWELQRGLNPQDPSDGPARSAAGSGYTNVELYLNELVTSAKQDSD